MTEISTGHLDLTQGDQVFVVEGLGRLAKGVRESVVLNGQLPACTCQRGNAPASVTLHTRCAEDAILMQQKRQDAVLVRSDPAIAATHPLIQKRPGFETIETRNSTIKSQ